MSLQSTIYIITSLISAATTLILAVHARRRRNAYGATAFGWMMALTTWWSVLGILYLLTNDPSTAITLRRLEYIAIAGIPVAWLLFILSFTRQDWWLTPTWVAALCAIPILTQFIIWTDGWLHHLWVGAGSSRLWYWIHTLYSYLLIFVGSILLAVSILRAKRLHRAQAITMLIGITLPLLLNIAYTLELFDINVIDLNSIVFSISGILFAWGMFGYRLFELAPMAREMLIDRMQDGMLVIDLQNRIADINPAARAILGIPSSGVIGYIADEVLPPLDILNASFKSWATLLNRKDWSRRSFEIVQATKNTERNYEMEILTLYDQQNHIAGRLIIFHEITLQKKAALATQSYARQLELQNAELEASNAELDAFAHTVAHDLKTPLTTLIGFSTLLKQRWSRMSTEQATKNLAVITQTGHKMTGIIEELLLLSSVRKQEAVKTEALMMGNIVMEARDRFERQIKESNATFSMPENWPTAIGYAPWVEEVWVNYISNALKYGGTPPHLELGAERQGAMVRFWVADNGPGLAPEAQAQLFTEFTRLDTMHAQGYGLGLSIVLRIITKLGGEVGVESKIDVGSKFWFTLRASEEVAVE